MATYMIYQRKKSQAVVEHINNKPNSVYASAYLALGMPTNDTAKTAVEDALYHDMYEPTMIMHDKSTVGNRTPFEAIFDEGNSYGLGDITTYPIAKPSSMSVGDLLVDLTRNQTHLCMPTGWYEIDVTLQLNVA